jgi:hypothetical protein
MSLQDLGNIGDFLGGIGVVVTLIYLAGQIRHNTRSIRASAFQAAQRDVAAVLDGLAHDAELTRIYFDGNRDFESFSREDRRRYATIFTSILRRYENLLQQSRLGSLDPDLWEGLRHELRRVFAQRGTRAYWTKGQDAFNRELRDFVNREIIASDAQDPAA